MEPYVIPKRNLTGDSTERVDTRVLQVIFGLDAGARVYAGQQLDVFIDAGGANERPGMLWGDGGGSGAGVGRDDSGGVSYAAGGDDGGSGGGAMVERIPRFGELDSLIARAVRANLDLKQAGARLMRRGRRGV